MDLPLCFVESFASLFGENPPYDIVYLRGSHGHRMIRVPIDVAGSSPIGGASQRVNERCTATNDPATSAGFSISSLPVAEHDWPLLTITLPTQRDGGIDSIGRDE